MHPLKHVIALALALTLAACGGGGGDSPAADTVLQPTSPGLTANGTASLNPDTHVMAGADLAGARLDGQALVVRKPQSTIHPVGAVLVMDSFGGRLIQITKVAETASEVHYSYTPATLDQAFKTLDVHISGTMTPDDLGASFVTNDPDLEIRWAEQTQVQSGAVAKAAGPSGPTLTASYRNLGISGSKITGSTTFALNPNITIKKTAEGSTRLAATIEPDFRTAISLLLSGTKSSEQKIYGHTFPTMTFLVGGIPITITPVLSIAQQLSFTGIKMTANAAYNANGRFGFIQTGNAKPDLIGQFSSTGNMDFTPEGAVEAGANIPKVELAFKIYGLGGPAFDASLSAKATGQNIPRKNPPLQCAKLDAELAIKANAGVKAGLSDISLSAMWELYSRTLYALNDGKGIYQPENCDKDDEKEPEPKPEEPKPENPKPPVPQPETPKPEEPKPEEPKPICKGTLTVSGTDPHIRNSNKYYLVTIPFTNLCNPGSQAQFCSPAYQDQQVSQVLLNAPEEIMAGMNADMDVSSDSRYLSQSCTYDGNSGSLSTTFRTQWVNERTGARGEMETYQIRTVVFK